MQRGRGGRGGRRKVRSSNNQPRFEVEVCLFDNLVADF